MGTDLAHCLHFKLWTWFTLVHYTAKGGLPMPWKEIKIMDQREYFVGDYLRRLSEGGLV